MIVVSAKFNDVCMCEFIYIAPSNNPTKALKSKY